MDVSAAAQGAVAQNQPAPEPAPPQLASVSSLPSAPQPQGLQPPVAPTALPHAQINPLASDIAKLFANTGISSPITLQVSYRVSHDPNVIVTVFTDPVTGREVAQIPPEVMLQIAQFFDKHSGVTLDKSA